MAFLEPSEMRRRLDRHAAWYRHELVGGPIVSLNVVPEAAVREHLDARHRAPVEDLAKLVAWWTDPAQVLARLEDRIAAYGYLGDIIPSHYVNLGTGSLAAYMGCRSVLQATTIWQEPLIDDWATAPELHLHEDSFYWQATQALTKASIAASRGRWLTGMTDIGGAMDITSYFRTPEELCLDLLDHPDEVRRSEAAVVKAWFQVYDSLWPMIQAASGGVSSWMGIWYPGRGAALQCDFSCMISPAMFREFVLPTLHALTARLDAAIYHLDGPNAIQHLDLICEVPNIRAIQWIPGAGHSWRLRDWLDLYRRIIDHGRAVWLWCPPDDELELLFDQLDPDLLFWMTNVDDQAAGEALQARIDRLRRDRKRVQ